MKHKQIFQYIFILFFFVATSLTVSAGGDAKHGHEGEDDFDFAQMILGHVTDANDWHLFGDVSIPLPIIAYQPDNGWLLTMSNKFHHGHDSYKGYVLDHGVLKFVKDPSFPKESVHVAVHKDKEGHTHVEANGKKYEASRSGFYDFSITKVVAGMMLAALIMFLLFGHIARAYRKRDVPKGVQSFFEPIILFVRDDIARPNLGDKADKYMPFLMSIFFFIWICNMLGLIPFLGSPNITGNISVTLTLAIFTFLVIIFSSTKDYWGHIFNPPGVPTFVKPILVLIEFLSVFIKPAALMIRLFANITGGHIMILSLVGLIFIFAKMGGAGAGFGSSIIAGAFILFMNFLEMFVAALQAYIFTVLSAVFIGQALEEHDHHGEEAHH